MPQNTHQEILNEEAEWGRGATEPSPPDLAGLKVHAMDSARAIAWVPGTRSSFYFARRCAALAVKIRPVLIALNAPLPKTPVSDDFHWLHDNLRLLYTELENTTETLRPLRKLPHVRPHNGRIMPRVAAVAEGLLSAAEYHFSEETFTAYLEAFQEITVLDLKELWAVIAAMKLVFLEQIAARGPQALREMTLSHGMEECIRGIRDIAQASWKSIIESLVRFDRILRKDPAGAYSRMDFESRELYRKAVVKIAERSDATEMEVAAEALKLAQEAGTQTYSNPRVATRRSHIGFFLIGEGAERLHQIVGFRPSIGQRTQIFLRSHPDEIYLPGILVLTLGIISFILLLLTPRYSPIGLVLFSMLVLLLPSSQAAIQLLNSLITALIPAEIIPKLNFSSGIPENCATLVAVPALLLNDDQIHRLVDDLEVRFLGNHGSNLYFALLTDLPDSRERPNENEEIDARVTLCAELVRCLNQKYANSDTGPFLFLHRHRVYNPHEGVWMGWERKRGKLLDLNKLLRNQYDSFPMKAGDLSVLPHIRYVLTLDADTELPRGAAHKMAGTLAHPLNQAIIDPQRNLVVAGYGILQPRVGVSVYSAARSRLANIFSGETGFDIYTRAVSDVYQDLYGTGSYAGKGIYEVDAVHTVLDRRFPRNALLSHDLIEGAYARAGLVSDIEVIEDYPSHYSAYNRRKHRWLRGDWQVAGWLRMHVPDETGRMVPNPIALISQWKILDNLRRSLVEPATLLLFVLGWLVLPGRPAYWSLAAVAILFLPVWFQFVFNLTRAAVERKRAIAQDATSAFLAANAGALLTLAFLAHQMLVSLDAVGRTFVRRTFTQRRLLEWETAAEAELGKGRRTPVDVYLNWMPALAVGLAILVFFGRPGAFLAAVPILILWGGSVLIAGWLNQTPSSLRKEISKGDELFLRHSALHIWRYFAEFSTDEHHWLVPDNVQEEPPAIAARISPTNIGFLLNCRQAACEFGYLTLPEFAEQTLRTLATLAQLRHFRGHLLNWYDTRTLEPLAPFFVSSVDSGNFVASLWTLQQGVLQQLREPLLRPVLFDGVLDFLAALAENGVFPPKQVSRLQGHAGKTGWLQALLAFPTDDLKRFSLQNGSASGQKENAAWFATQTCERIEQAEKTVRRYTPWLLPEFEPLQRDPALNLASAAEVMLLKLPEFADKLSLRLLMAIQKSGAEEQRAAYRQLLSLLPSARANAERLIRDLRAIASAADNLAATIDFSFLLDKHRSLLSVGFDVQADQLHSACYDLLASESRIAAFVGIAKDEIPQDTWFLLGRAHTLDRGQAILLSWTGTMFEYLMPTLWMQSYPNTLLERSRAAAVRLQRAYADSKRVPWGISESAYFKTDEAGNYQYHAFGLPRLALHKDELNALVISPYSTFLALHVDAAESMRNLRRMKREGWSGKYGFYESADFSTHEQHRWRQSHQLVRCWMAHHHGMSLLSIANFLHDGIIQKWFHSHPRVQSAELLLHEKPVSYVRPAATGYAAPGT